MRAHIQPKIVIVGAGPTGLMLACELAKHNIPFKIIDKNSGPAKESRAFGIQARSLEIFDQMGLVQKMLNEGKVIQQGHIYVAPREHYILKFDQIESKFPFILMLSQYKTEQILIAKLEDSGHKVCWNTRFLDLKQEKGVEVLVQNSEGEVEEIQADFIVACDGAHSEVRKAAGIAAEGSTANNYWLLADCHTEWEREVNEVRIYLDKKGINAYFPFTDTIGRLMFELPANIRRENFPEPKHLEMFARSRGLPVTKVDQLQWLSFFKLDYELASHYRKGKVFLAGDAAHIQSPVGAQGLNTGIQDAFNLAWKLAYYLKGKVNDNVLDSYEKERRKIGKNVVRATSVLTQFLRAKNPVGRFLKRFTFTTLMGSDFLRKKIINTIAQVHLNYENSELVDDYWMEKETESKVIKAGDRLENFSLTSVKERENIGISELVNSSKFSLFLVVGYPWVDDNYYEIYTFYRNILTNYSDLVNVHLIFPEELAVYNKNINFSSYIDKGNELHQAFSIHSNALILVRPDGYIAYRNAPLNSKAFDEYMVSKFIRREKSEFKRYA